jgi:class 3 adenylate cyclase/tetratricopeptide (TPR) repeat protein
MAPGGIDCVACGTNNRVGSKFCNDCGRPLSRTCGSCGTASPANTKFCDECGARFGAERASREEPSSGVTRLQPLEAERRPLTVMFCDLVGSTRLAGRLDPEDLRELILSHQRCAHDVVRSFDGHVAQHLGDGLLVYFGYPHAHEDDARRAVLSALGILDALDTLNQRIRGQYGVELTVRIGVETGNVVVGAVGGAERSENLAMGGTPNIAARIQAEAPPGAVLVGPGTRRLIERDFELEPLGARALHNVSEPMELFRVVGPSGATARRAAVELASAELVGRETEMSVLLGSYRDARQARGRTVVITGEAGIGKTRLVAQLRAHLASHELWIQTGGSPYRTDSALQPIVEAADALWRVDPAAPPAERQSRLAATCEELGLDAATVRVLGDLLGVALPEADYPALTLSPQTRRARTLAAVKATILGHAARRPVVLCVEDLHWIDQTTIDLLEMLCENVGHAALLVVLTARPDHRVHLPVGCEILLRGLPAQDARNLVRDCVSAALLPHSVVEAIVSRSDGNPLFLEEIAKMVVEQRLAEGNGASDYAIPTSLQASLVARLDRLGPARKVVHVGAAIGRRFSFELAREVLDMGREELDDALQRLTTSGLLTQQGVAPEATYAFRHALIRDAAYGSLTRRFRVQVHQRISEVLRGRFPDTPDEVLAYHLEEAGDLVAAAGAWLAAGQAALGSFALAEAQGHLRRGLGCVEQLPQSADRLNLELSLQVTMGVPLMLTRGFAAPEVEKHYAHVHELCLEAGPNATPQLFPALFGLWTFFEVSASYLRAEEMGRRLLELGERTGDSGIRLAGHVAFGGARLMLGDLGAARTHFEQGLEIYDRERHAPLAMLFGQDGGAMCASFLTWVYAHDGDAAAARRCVETSLRMRDELGHPGTCGFVDAVVATHHCLMAEPEPALALADAATALGVEEGMPHWAAQGAINRGWALSGLGRAEEAAPMIRANIAALLRLGTRAAMGYFHGALVAAELARGDLDAADRALADAFEFADKTGELLYEAELRRMQGEVALLRGDHAAARVAFRRALERARAQGARAFELRATARLAELGPEESAMLQ